MARSGRLGVQLPRDPRIFVKGIPNDGNTKHEYAKCRAKIRSGSDHLAECSASLGGGGFDGPRRIFSSLAFPKGRVAESDFPERANTAIGGAPDRGAATQWFHSEGRGRCSKGPTVWLSAIYSENPQASWRAPGKLRTNSAGIGSPFAEELGSALKDQLSRHPDGFAVGDQRIESGVLHS